jgi:hypothetical protein
MKLPKKKSLAKECEDLWKKCIKARCDGRSEFSGQPSRVIHPHHLMHKPNHRLRFELENGMALTPYEHHFMAHGARAEEFRDGVIKRIGQEKYDWLKSLRGGCQKTDLNLVKIHLTEKLREWGG